MITYSSTYSSGEMPYIVKTLKVGTQSMDAEITPASGASELDLIPLEVLQTHLDNLLSYIKDETIKMTVFTLNDSDISGGYPFRGYKKIEDAAFKSHEWWSYVYNNREIDEETPA